MSLTYTLSVITVTKNCAATINKTLDSVELIRSPDIEYIVIDGGSTDGTLEILNNRTNLIDCLISEPDSGIYNAMNKGVAHSNGWYVVFLNGDDVFVADGFDDVLDILRKKIKRIICASTIVGKLESPDEVLIPSPKLLPLFNSIPHPSAFVARDLLLRWPFREDLRIVSDYDFFLRAYLAKEEFVIIPYVISIHRRGGASGNVSLSRIELASVRRRQLGKVLLVYNFVLLIYRIMMKFGFFLEKNGK